MQFILPLDWGVGPFFLSWEGEDGEEERNGSEKMEMYVLFYDFILIQKKKSDF